MAVKKRPIRTCIACRTSGDKNQLIRIVRSASGEVVIDPTGKKPGRGAYICRRAECITAAFKKKSFDRALRTAVPAGLQEELLKAVQEQANDNADRRTTGKSHETLNEE